MTIQQAARFEEILSPRDSGMLMPDKLRSTMENLFNSSFERIRIHLDERVPRCGALAMASGDDLFFPPSIYDPNDRAFQRLVAHELTHVLQQREGRVAAPDYDDFCLIDDRELESEADDMAVILSLLQQSGLTGSRNLISRPARMAVDDRSKPKVLQCVLLHARDAMRKVDWVDYLPDQNKAAKKIIDGIKNNGTDSLKVTGLNGEKFGHESTGQMDSNPSNKSVTVWWKQSFGRGVKNGYQTVRNTTIGDGIGVCGLGTHLPEHKGKPAYRLLWRVSSGLCDRFFIDNSTVTRMPSPPPKKED